MFTKQFSLFLSSPLFMITILLSFSKLVFSDYYDGDDSVDFESREYETVDSCTFNETCQESSLGRSSTCSKGVCICDKTSTRDPTTGVCVKRAKKPTEDKCETDQQTGKCRSTPAIKQKLGDSCEKDDSQCDSVEGSVCDEERKVCVCRENETVADRNNNKCLPVVSSLRQWCEQSQQCQVKGSECRNSQCLCKEGLAPGKDNSCLGDSRNVGENCIEDEECAGVGAQCNNGTCQCRSESKVRNGRCVRPVPLNRPCESDEECVAGGNEETECVQRGPEKVCSCKSGAIQKAQMCVNEQNAKKLGDSCETDAQCKATIPGPVYCSRDTGVCTCDDNNEDDCLCRTNEESCHSKKVDMLQNLKDKMRPILDFASGK